MHGLIEQMNRFTHTSSALIQSISYRIIEITDEELPLAPGPVFLSRFRSNVCIITIVVTYGIWYYVL